MEEQDSVDLSMFVDLAREAGLKNGMPSTLPDFFSAQSATRAILIGEAPIPGGSEEVPTLSLFFGDIEAMPASHMVTLVMHRDPDGGAWALGIYPSEATASEEMLAFARKFGSQRPGEKVTFDERRALEIAKCFFQEVASSVVDPPAAAPSSSFVH